MRWDFQNGAWEVLKDIKFPTIKGRAKVYDKALDRVATNENKNSSFSEGMLKTSRDDRGSKKRAIDFSETDEASVADEKM